MKFWDGRRDQSVPRSADGSFRRVAPPDATVVRGVLSEIVIDSKAATLSKTYDHILPESLQPSLSSYSD
jgi:hypothetical protein